MRVSACCAGKNHAAEQIVGRIKINERGNENMKSRYLVCFVALMTAAIVAGCGSSKPKAERINLDKVISIMMDTLKETDTVKETDKKATVSDPIVRPGETTSTSADKDKPKVAPITKMDAEKEKKFLEKFAENLNKAHLKSTSIGVAMLPDGAIEGFEDPNTNMKKDAGEKSLFKIHVDQKRNRVIASDTVHGQHRDHSLASGVGGLMMGYMLGRMLTRQSASGFDTRQFEQMKMSPPASQTPAQRKSIATGKSAEDGSGVKKPSGGSRGFTPKSRGGRSRR